MVDLFKGKDVTGNIPCIGQRRSRRLVAGLEAFLQLDSVLKGLLTSSSRLFVWDWNLNGHISCGIQELVPRYYGEELKVGL